MSNTFTQCALTHNQGMNWIPKIGTFFGNKAPKKAPIVSTSYAGR